MHLRRTIVAVVSAIVALPTARPAAQPKRPPSVDDLMTLRAIVDVQIAPDGQRVAYVVSTPNLAKNEHRVTTPLLIQHGEADPRVPIAGAWKLYRTLKAMGKTVELEIYPRGGHVLREPRQQREQMRRNLEWFAKWIATGS